MSDPTNHDRAKWTREALKTYAKRLDMGCGHYAAEVDGC